MSNRDGNGTYSVFCCTHHFWTEENHFLGHYYKDKSLCSSIERWQLTTGQNFWIQLTIDDTLWKNRFCPLFPQCSSTDTNWTIVLTYHSTYYTIYLRFRDLLLSAFLTLDNKNLDLPLHANTACCYSLLHTFKVAILNVTLGQAHHGPECSFVSKTCANFSVWQPPWLLLVLPVVKKERVIPQRLNTLYQRSNDPKLYHKPP